MCHPPSVISNLTPNANVFAYSFFQDLSGCIEQTARSKRMCNWASSICAFKPVAVVNAISAMLATASLTCFTRTEILMYSTILALLEGPREMRVKPELGFALSPGPSRWTTPFLLALYQLLSHSHFSV